MGIRVEEVEEGGQEIEDGRRLEDIIDGEVLGEYRIIGVEVEVDDS